MSRIKGTPKTGGREAGTPNKITGTLKDFVANLVNDNRQQIIDDLGKLRPKERLAMLERMMQYVLPKQQAVSADLDLNGLNNEIVVTYICQSPDDFNFPSSEDEIDLERDIDGHNGII